MRHIQIEEFWQEKEKEYMQFLEKLPGYPYVCDWASEILVGYIHNWYDAQPTYIGGIYGVSQEMNEVSELLEETEYHSWIELEGGSIIDPTRVQYIDEGGGQTTYLKKGNAFCTMYYSLDEQHVREEIISIARRNREFSKYLAEIWRQREYLGFC